MSMVSLISQPDYAQPGLDQAVKRAVDLIGGMDAFVKPGCRVLLKPNLLSGQAPEKAVTTHPEMVKAVARLVMAAGGRPFIADSPAIETWGRVIKKSGMAQAAEDLGIDLRPLDDPLRVEVPGGAVYTQLEIARQALEADVVINLPKLKTHGHMLLTMGVKNLFGTVVAQRKAEWHLMVGSSRDTFAALLLDIHRVIKPALTVMDGVWGMEGKGPANGAPRKLGLVAASSDALALDLTMCRLLGVSLDRLPLYRAALAQGLVKPGEPGAELAGDPAEPLMVNDFEAPQLDSMDLLPGFMSGWAQKHMVSKPAQDAAKCVACGKCAEMCPAHSLELQGKVLAFDYNDCIRCYCCQEVCPEDAIYYKTGWLVRLLNRFGR